MTPILEKLITIIIGKLLQIVIPKIEKGVGDWLKHLIEKMNDKKESKKYDEAVESDQTRDERRKSEDDFLGS